MLILTQGRGDRHAGFAAAAAPPYRSGKHGSARPARSAQPQHVQFNIAAGPRRVPPGRARLERRVTPRRCGAASPISSSNLSYPQVIDRQRPAAGQAQRWRPRPDAPAGQYLFGLGFFDPATRAGLERHDEDFGQTLGRWGVPAGPYLMLPLFGPVEPARRAGARLPDEYTRRHGITSTTPTLRWGSVRARPAGDCARAARRGSGHRQRLRPLRLRAQCLAAAARIPGARRRRADGSGRSCWTELRRRIEPAPTELARAEPAMSSTSLSRASASSVGDRHLEAQFPGPRRAPPASQSTSSASPALSARCVAAPRSISMAARCRAPSAAAPARRSAATVAKVTAPTRGDSARAPASRMRTAGRLSALALAARRRAAPAFPGAGSPHRGPSASISAPKSSRKLFT